jgi:succinyl-CoA synthetase alpha subunit
MIGEIGGDAEERAAAYLNGEVTTSVAGSFRHNLSVGGAPSPVLRSSATTMKT